MLKLKQNIKLLNKIIIVEHGWVINGSWDNFSTASALA